jgi:hypothetical protein
MQQIAALTRLDGAHATMAELCSWSRQSSNNPLCETSSCVTTCVAVRTGNHILKVSCCVGEMQLVVSYVGQAALTATGCSRELALLTPSPPVGQADTQT